MQLIERSRCRQKEKETGEVMAEDIDDGAGADAEKGGKRSRERIRMPALLNTKEQR